MVEFHLVASVSGHSGSLSHLNRVETNLMLFIPPTKEKEKRPIYIYVTRLDHVTWSRGTPYIKR